jgi:hypothetical protein
MMRAAQRFPLGEKIAAARRNPKVARPGRWRLEFLDGSGRPTGSRRRPKTKTEKANKPRPSSDDNPQTVTYVIGKICSPCLRTFILQRAFGARTPS